MESIYEGRRGKLLEEVVDESLPVPSKLSFGAIRLLAICLDVGLLAAVSGLMVSMQSFQLNRTFNMWKSLTLGFRSVLKSREVKKDDVLVALNLIKSKTRDSKIKDKIDGITSSLSREGLV